MPASRTNRILGAAALVTALALGSAVDVRAGAVVGATEFTQIANNVQLVAQYGKQVQMVIQQAQMIENQLNAYQLQMQNTQQLTGLQWTNATSDINQLAQIAQTGANVAYVYAAQDTAYTALHQTYAQYLAQNPGAPTPATYQKWSAYNMDAATRASNAAGMTFAQANNEQSRIAALKAAGATPQGQVQAIMAANALAAEMLDQLRQLKLLIAQQMDSQARYQKMEEEKKTQDAAALQNVTAPPTGNNATDASYGQMPTP
jgi:P-type conjugative transfer protein TrbJ